MAECVSKVTAEKRFRPLSWGLSFNNWTRCFPLWLWVVFVPFLGDFLSMEIRKLTEHAYAKFSSPFLGTFFQ